MILLLGCLIALSTAIFVVIVACLILAGRADNLADKLRQGPGLQSSDPDRVLKLDAADHHYLQLEKAEKLITSPKITTYTRIDAL